MTNDKQLEEIREAVRRANASIKDFARASTAIYGYTIAMPEPKKPKKTNYAKWNGGKK